MSTGSNSWEVNLSFWRGFSRLKKEPYYELGARDGLWGESGDESSSDEEANGGDDDSGLRIREDGILLDSLDISQTRTTQLVRCYESGKLVLREPRKLYDSTIQQEAGGSLARWPIEMEVLSEKVTHIANVPSVKEPLYKPNISQESRQLPEFLLTAFQERIVYEYEPMTSKFFTRSRANGSPAGCTRPVAVHLTSSDDATLIFESRFESGNLLRAAQVGEYDYRLWLRSDLYTEKHAQWYYFRVTNTRPNITYRFTIVNFLKSSSLYCNGLKPLMYSERRAKTVGVGWTRTGSDILYYKDTTRFWKPDVPYYCLTWSFEFPHLDDVTYFAHCYPYTYTNLQRFLSAVGEDPLMAPYLKQRVLCRTLAGNLVHLLTITSPQVQQISAQPQTSKSYESDNGEKVVINRPSSQQKKYVVFTARVHPGESNSSWMMKGLLDFLLGTSEEAKNLRDSFVFKVIPMLNPDGVIVGNSRCSLTGRDLNRNYRTILRDSFPSAWHTRNMISRLLKNGEVTLYCDLHGHSRKQNVFLYGCENRDQVELRLHERVFPLMLSTNAPDMFCYESCKFKIEKRKEGTGRVVMWTMGILNSFTVEATFCGSSLANDQSYHFNADDFQSVGHVICRTLLDYADPDPTKRMNILMDLQEKFKANLGKKEVDGDIYGSSKEIDTGDNLSSDSDSSGSDGLPAQLEFLRFSSGGPLARRRAKKKKVPTATLR